MSALAPLLGDKQTSCERIRNDAIDPLRSSRTAGKVDREWTVEIVIVPVPIVIVMGCQTLS
jgi:hypothetical protein